MTQPKVYCDASVNKISCALCRVLVKWDEKGKKTIKCEEKKIPIGKNVIDAEYKAIIYALEIAPKYSMLFSDSLKVVNQLQDKYPVNGLHEKEYIQAKQMLVAKEITLVWTPREANLAGHKLQKRLKRLHINKSYDKFGTADSEKQWKNAFRRW